MRRILLQINLLNLLALLLSALPGSAGAPVDFEPLRQKPITTAPGKVGDLLRQWWKDGTAAGNVGDFYDNRDGDHSPLNLAPYPQLSAIKYSPADVKLFKHWAAQRIILPHVTFGNSSTSAPPTLGGSNPRMYYTSVSWLMFLYEEYTRNNLYIYPEHRDHDPGHNGKNDGFGDLYPTNTPYLLISQGSSGSDQPFMRMLPFVLASFKPEVKKKLTETGTLMPAIQMLFRSTNKHLKDPKEYLTGKAHPSVFEGAWVDDLALVQKAHALDVNALPPMVQLRAVAEDKATNGVDYFDTIGTEVLGNTPCCIARIHRSKAQQHRLTIDAGASYDLNKRPLTYTWVVLRGDPSKIKIVPKKDDSSLVEITAAYQERRPIAPGAAMESNRVDIGVFVHNGVHYSAPGFVTIFTLDSEARTYDAEGKILEIAYGMGETDLRVQNWEKLLQRIQTDESAGKWLSIDAQQKAGFADLLTQHDQLRSVHKEKAQQVDALQAELKAAGKNPALQKKLDAARQGAAKAQKALSDLLDCKLAALGDSPRHFMEARLTKLTQDPQLLQKHPAWLKEPRVQAKWQKLVRWGLAAPDKMLSKTTWTKFERALLEAFQGVLLSEVAFPSSLQYSYRLNFVDQRLSAPRSWRDLYRYDPQGARIGWTRYSDAGKQEFNYEGLLIVEMDMLGRGKTARSVRYVQDASKGRGFNPNPLHAVPGDALVRYEFAGDADLRGRRAGTEPAPAEKK